MSSPQTLPQRLRQQAARLEGGHLGAMSEQDMREAADRIEALEASVKTARKFVVALNYRERVLGDRAMVEACEAWEAQSEALLGSQS